MNPSPNNVILFPKKKLESHPQSLDEVRDSVDNIKKQVAEIIIDESVGTVFKALQNYKIAVKEKDSMVFMKDISLIVEAIRAAVFRSLEYSHPLHNISGDMFEISNTGNEVSFNKDFMDKYINCKGEDNAGPNTTVKNI